MVVYDVLGIGIGPFNLGLAALAEETDLRCLFIDQSEEFNWHAGMLLDRARLQVPYYADLVTLVNPTSKFTYLNYLHRQEKLFDFSIHDNPFVLRKEYNNYCKWVVTQLNNCMFKTECLNITYHDNLFTVYTNRGSFFAKRIVIGIGPVPDMPVNDCDGVFHISEYLFRKPELAGKRICIVGSGQSAAEIFYDLLCNAGGYEALRWFTRSPLFYPMDYSKLNLHMSSPAYIDYFFRLGADRKLKLLANQAVLYKGINNDLINAIYDELYVQRVNGVSCVIDISASCELIEIKGLCACFLQTDTGQTFETETDVVILATGYKYEVPAFLRGIAEMINWRDDGFYEVNKNYSIDFDNRVFVQNADLFSHGFNSADLGLGPYRNAVILNTILGRQQFKTEHGKILFKNGGAT